MIKAVLLDHDGTMVNSEESHYQLWKKVIGLPGERFTDQMYAEHCIGVPTHDNAEYLKSEFGLKQSIEELVQSKIETTKTFLETEFFPMMQGCLELLNWLKQSDLRVAVVSGSERYAVDRSLEGNRLVNFIEHINTGDEVANNKPSPDVYLLALERLGLRPEECLAVEDTYHGLLAATAANIKCIAVPNLYSRHQDFSASEITLSGLPEVLEYLQTQIA